MKKAWANLYLEHKCDLWVLKCPSDCACGLQGQRLPARSNLNCVFLQAFERCFSCYLADLGAGPNWHFRSWSILIVISLYFYHQHNIIMERTTLTTSDEDWYWYATYVTFAIFTKHYLMAWNFLFQHKLAVPEWSYCVIGSGCSLVFYNWLWWAVQWSSLHSVVHQLCVVDCAQSHVCRGQVCRGCPARPHSGPDDTAGGYGLPLQVASCTKHDYQVSLQRHTPIPQRGRTRTGATMHIGLLTQLRECIIP